jgi:ATP-dependent RNA helicase RhlE
MTFEELNLTKPLLNALNDLGYTQPTTIQANVFSVVMSGRDVCGIAQTGTGKTIAYLLPALRQYQFSTTHTPQLLILVPTRELVVQVVETIQALTRYMSVQTVGVYGGVNLKPQAAQVMAGADVLVATPGRVVDLLASGVLKTKQLRRLVIDEFDEMLNLGFRAQLTKILDLLPPKRQNLLFSATQTDEATQLMGTFFNDPVLVEAAPAGTPLKQIEQRAYAVPNFNTKVNLLEVLIREDPAMTKVLVFVATKALADQLFDELDGRFDEGVGVIHANKAQNYRFETVRRFEAGELPILIATDLISRGLDLTGVSHVVNFDLPDEPESYIHRIGRTGRADQKGIAIAFVTEADRDRLSAIEALMKASLTVWELPEFVPVSAVLTEAEMPQVRMKIVEPKRPKPAEVGPAFHEKKAKNQKVNVRRDHEAEKKAKYGKSYKKGRT